MTDTTTTDKERREKFLDWFLLVILRRIDEGEYHEVDHAVGDAQCLARYFRTLQSRLDQAHWDAISRDQTIETLRAKYDRLRDILDWGLTETHAFYPGQELHSYRSRWQRVMAQAGEAIYGWPQDEYYGVWNKANDEHDQLYTVVPLTEHNLTIENLRAENARYREALEWYGAWENQGWKDYGGPDQHAPLIRDCGERARAALGMGVTS